MRKKIFLYFIMMILVVSCSSKDKVENSSKSSNHNNSTIKKVNAQSSKPVSLENDSKSNEELKFLLSKHDDEGVYRAATAKLVQNPLDIDALNSMGLYHLHKNRPLAAKYFIRRALQQKQESAELHSNLGITYMKMKETKDAIREFKKSLEINSGHFQAGMNLGYLYLSNHDYQKAYTVLGMFATQGKDDTNFLNNYAMSAAASGKIEEAENLYKQALQAGHNQREILYNFAILQIDYLKKYREGLGTLDRLKILGLGENMRNNANALENRAKAGLK